MSSSALGLIASEAPFFPILPPLRRCQIGHRFNGPYRAAWAGNGRRSPFCPPRNENAPAGFLCAGNLIPERPQVYHHRRNLAGRSGRGPPQALLTLAGAPNYANALGLSGLPGQPSLGPPVLLDQRSACRTPGHRYRRSLFPESGGAAGTHPFQGFERPGQI